MPMQDHLKTTIMYAVLCGAVGVLLSACRNNHKTQSQTATTVFSSPEIRKASIVFGGDVMIHLPQITAAKRDTTYDFAETFRHIRPFLERSDLAIVNLETTISADGHYSGYPLFAAPAELAYDLKESGVDVVTLANNHICDKGAEGITATVNTLEKAGLRYTGAFADSASYASLNPLKTEINGIRFAILNYTYGTNGMPVPEGCIVNITDTATITSDLSKIDKANTDHIIVCFHWGLEYSRTPTVNERELASWCRDQGIDIVIGIHPHVIQPLEASCDTSGEITSITAYSLGNLVSNQRKRYTDGGMLLRLDIIHTDSLPANIEAGYMLTWTHISYSNGLKHYHILPSHIADTTLKEGSTARTAYDTFINDSRTLLDGNPYFKEITADDSIIARAYKNSRRLVSR